MAPPQIQLLCADVLQPSTLILTGRAEDGRSVSVEVSDAFPYFWLLLPPTWLTDPDKNARRHPLRWALEALWKDLDVEVRRRAANEVNDGRAKRGNAERIDAEHWEKEMLRISFCGDVKEFHRFHGYDADPRKFARVSFASVSALRHARDALMAPKRWLKSMKDKRDMLPASFELAEAQVDFTVQACADAGLIPGGWFTLRPTVRPCKSRARTNLSYRVELFDILPLDRAGLAPIRVLAFDIEVITKDLGNGATRFYDGDNEEGKCLCIAACSMVAGVPGMDRLVFAIDPDSLAERVQTVDATSGEGSVTIHWLPDEKSVLLAFIAHTNRCDPDFVTGWNTDRFDWGWLALAAQRLGIDSFWDFSRFANYPKAYYNVRLYTDKVLARQLKKKVILQTPGRVPYDLFTWFKRNYQLASYKLDFVAHTYGCGAKDDMPYHLIGEAFKTQEGRLKLALYCGSLLN
jgi:DNA polymerase elongation subunit (family B)